MNLELDLHERIDNTEPHVGIYIDDVGSKEFTKEKLWKSFLKIKREYFKIKKDTKGTL